ncbi:two-component response regulator [Neosynechococcus sphagnicola sy1]|uniref:Two-component response regulator n=1 Tax=Neosynechococcus sphagnicola sy1 TaxID=1497020 RepID=A0A098TMI4_9CYAN|nr:response regulator [Neosynechococcus sphagnicola]KGF72053.1 two-component response regulator [Neosynechococcus sphagnicola sy1]
MANRSEPEALIGNILLVDDTLENLEVLDQLLTTQGYDVRRAINGPMALMGVAAEAPDLILLDIMMPDMDGFQVCAHLKSNPATQAIPVIFISALDAAEDKVKAFAVGGVDYIPKPFQTAEVLARVENQMAIATLRKLLEQKSNQLLKQNHQLQDVLSERRQTLASIQEADERYRDMFENAAVGIFQCSATGRYFRVNAALAAIYGYASPPDLLWSVANPQGKLPYVDPNHWTRFTQQMAVQGLLKSLQAQVYRADGSIVTILESVRTVKNQEGQFLYYEGFVQEIPPVV